MCNMKNKSNQELFSAILGKNAYKVAELTTKNLYCMEDTAQLYQYGLTEEEALRLLASAMLAKKMFNNSSELTYIQNSCDVATLFMPKIGYLSHEEFWVIALDVHTKIVATKKISQGTLTQANVHPREVFEFACLNHAHTIIAVHNHPSGNPAPSKDDDKLTKSLLKAGKTMYIPLIDHVIVGDGAYYSYLEDKKI